MKMDIRLAQITELKQIERLMKRSMNFLGKGHYSSKQIAACCQFVCVPDRQIIEDGTFFVVESDTNTLVGCGGWSFRNKLYAGPEDDNTTGDYLNPLTDKARIRAMFTDPDYSGKGIGSLILEYSENAARAYGFSKASLGSTVSGLAFYKAKGWMPTSEEQATLPNGEVIRVVQMEKDLGIS